MRRLLRTGDGSLRVEGIVLSLTDSMGAARPAVRSRIPRRAEDGLLDCLPDAVLACDGAGTITRSNRRATELLGATAVADTPLAGWLEEVLATARPLRDREGAVLGADGAEFHVSANIDPLFDRDGVIAGAVATIRVTPPRSLGGEWYRSLLEALPAAVYTTDAEGRVTFFNQAAADIAGRRPQIGVDRWCVTWRLTRTDGTPLPFDQCPMAVALTERRPVRGVEAVVERPDGTRVPMLPFPTPLFDADGKLVGGMNMLVDISERRSSDACHKTLVDEVNHRAMNTLATVQSLAAQTMRGAAIPCEVSAKFEGRLLALSRAHDRLSRALWQHADLQGLLQDVFAGMVPADRVHFTGSAVSLPPRTALALAMVFHELAANAVQHGALSVPAGELDVAWQVSGCAVQIAWTERGGPPVRAPQGKGFGLRLLETTVARELGGNADIRFDESGAICTMSVPLAAESR